MKTLDKLPNIIKLIILVRILIPFIIFVHPLIAFVFSQVADAFDGQMYFNAKVRWHVYNRIDKTLDYWWYIFIIIYFNIHFPSLFILAVGLLIYRTIGQFYSMYFNKEKVFIFFPNILEWFFVLLILFPNINTFIALGASVLIGIYFEWVIHFSSMHWISKYVFKKEIIWRR